MRLLPFALASIPAVALATNFPYVTKGPVITSVTPTDAWVAWETAHHEGKGTDPTDSLENCDTEASLPLIGDHNNDTPTLTLSDGETFTDATCSRDHHVHLTGLAPNTHHSFTLDKPFDSSTGPTAGGEFTTATTDPDARFSFIVYGDNRDDQALTGTSTQTDHQAVANAIADDDSDAAFIINTGDLALNITAVSGDDNGYTEFFDVERALLSTRPLFTAIGNHETIDTSEFDTLINPRSWEGLPHPYYWSFDWGAAHFAILDAFEGAKSYAGLGDRAPGVSDAQAQWLDQDLAQAQAKGQILIVVAHQSPFSHPAPNETSGHGDSVPMQQKILPILLKYGVYALFAGHDHYYQHGHEGCLDYFVVGGGGAPQYKPDPNAPGVIAAVETTSYVVVTVSGHQATGIAKATSGDVLDQFTLTPANGAPCGVTTVGPAGGPDGGTTGPDAGAPGVDAGTSAADAGGAAVADAGSGAGPTTTDAGAQPTDAGGQTTSNAHAGGCQCGLGGGASALVGLLLLSLALARRRRTQ